MIPAVLVGLTVGLFAAVALYANARRGAQPTHDHTAARVAPDVSPGGRAMPSDNQDGRLRRDLPDRRT